MTQSGHWLCIAAMVFEPLRYRRLSLGGGHAAARVHHVSRRRAAVRVAACGAGAAAGGEDLSGSSVYPLLTVCLNDPRPFAWACAISAIRRDRILSSSTDGRMATTIGSRRSAADLVRLKVGRDHRPWRGAGRLAAKCHLHDPHRDGRGRRCIRVGSRVQSRAAGRQRDRIDVLPGRNSLRNGSSCSRKRCPA